MLRFIIVLTLVCVCAALVLGITYSATKPLITAQKERETKAALEKVLPDADEYKTGSSEGKEYYEAYSSGRLLGYALFADGNGYAGNIQMLVGIDIGGKITGLEVLSQSETPGLGARCVEIKPGENQPWFLRQFKGKRDSDLIPKSIDAITGATITSQAIMNGARAGVSNFLHNIKKR